MRLPQLFTRVLFFAKTTSSSRCHTGWQFTVMVLIVGAISLIVIVAVAVTGAGAGGGGAGFQQRTGKFFGRSGGADAGVVSVIVNCTLNVPVLFGVNVKSGVLPPCACPFSVH